LDDPFLFFREWRLCRRPAAVLIRHKGLLAPIDCQQMRNRTMFSLQTCGNGRSDSLRRFKETLLCAQPGVLSRSK